MAKRGRSKKNPYDMLDAETKSAIEGSSDEQINSRIADVAKNDAALADAKKLDGDILEKKAALKEANRSYVEAHKRNSQVIKYGREILSARGKDAGDSGLE